MSTVQERTRSVVSGIRALRVDVVNITKNVRRANPDAPLLHTVAFVCARPKDVRVVLPESAEGVYHGRDFEGCVEFLEMLSTIIPVSSFPLTIEIGIFNERNIDKDTGFVRRITSNGHSRSVYDLGDMDSDLLSSIISADARTDDLLMNIFVDAYPFEPGNVRIRMILGPDARKAMGTDAQIAFEADGRTQEEAVLKILIRRGGHTVLDAIEAGTPAVDLLDRFYLLNAEIVEVQKDPPLTYLNNALALMHSRRAVLS